jgi:hypothetical protein
MTPSKSAIRELVRAECARPTNAFGPAFFEQHVLVVLAHARALARRLGADPEVVELAAHLHDLAAVRDVACVPTHHLEGAAAARGILQAQGWRSPVVDAVCRAIETHSAPVERGAGSLEEVCVSNADVMAHLSRPAYWFFYLHRVRGLDQREALAWWRGRAERAWGALAPEARAMVAADHAIVVRLLEGAGGAPSRHHESEGAGRVGASPSGATACADSTQGGRARGSEVHMALRGRWSLPGSSPWSSAARGRRTPPLRARRRSRWTRAGRSRSPTAGSWAR